MSATDQSVAIIGSGIAGLTIADGLHGKRPFVVYESEAWIGGHTHTHDVELDGERRAGELDLTAVRRGAPRGSRRAARHASSASPRSAQGS